MRYLKTKARAAVRAVGFPPRDVDEVMLLIAINVPVLMLGISLVALAAAGVVDLGPTR